jgi:hypothetical protein
MAIVTARPNARQRTGLAVHRLTPRCPITVVTGPPCAGKSTLVADLAGPADVRIDLDLLALAIAAPGTTHHDYEAHVRFIAMDMRNAAIRKAATMPTVPHLWIIHGHPNPDAVDRYLRWDATFVAIDPGELEVRRRCRAERPPRVMGEVTRWYTARPMLPGMVLIASAADLATTPHF